VVAGRAPPLITQLAEAALSMSALRPKADPAYQRFEFR
jgi:hypothetical protein